MTYTFYLVCPIGFETLATAELKQKWAHRFPNENLPSVNQTKGGIEVDLPLRIGLELNLWLRIPNRILIRIKSQTCRDLPKLFSIIKKIPWRDWLVQDNIQFKISSSKSRLIHTNRIEQTATEAFEKFCEGQKLSKYHQKLNLDIQTIYLRWEEDLLTISLDTTGDHLHKRGWSTHRGFAGIRENMAFACLSFLFQNQEFPDEIFDPMCGSGTFLREFKHQFDPLAQRKFSFENWKPILDNPIQPPLSEPSKTLKTFGNDLNTDVTESIREEFTLITQGDFFQLKDLPCSYLIMNPPYGKRVKIEKDRKQFFKEIIEKITELSPKKAGIIIPEDVAGGFKNTRALAFNQNGIKVKFLVFEF